MLLVFKIIIFTPLCSPYSLHFLDSRFLYIVHSSFLSITLPIELIFKNQSMIASSCFPIHYRKRTFS